MIFPADSQTRSLLFAWLTTAACVAFVAASGAFSEAPLAVGSAWLVAGFGWWSAMRSVRAGGGTLRAIVGGAIVLRLLAACAAPQLTDDIHRYVWEGGLVADGVSPYAHAPSDPALAEYRQRWPDTYRRVGHPEVSAAYPPGMQFATAGIVALAGGPEASDGVWAERALKLFFGLCDLVVLWPLVALLRRRGSDPRLCVAWAFCPLAVFEFSASAHFDSLAILALVAGLAFASAGHLKLASATLGAGALVKLLPILAVPFAARGHGPAGGLAAVMVAGLVLAAGVLAVVLGLAGGGAGLLAGLTEYGVRWEAGSLVHRWIEGLLAGERDRTLGDPRLLSRALLVALFLGVAAWAWLRRDDTVRATDRLIGAFLLLTPTLHPWYVCWKVPFLAVRPAASWTWLVVAAPLLYAPLPRWQREGVWEEPAWLWPTLALPFAALFLFEAVRARRTKRSERE